MRNLFIMLLAIIAVSSCTNDDGGKQSWSSDFVGSMTTKDAQTNQTVYQADNVQATIELPNAIKSVINFQFDNVQFVSNMPSLSIVIPNLAFTVYSGADGVYPAGAWIIDQQNVIPTIGGVPYENYKMNTVTGVITDEYVKLEFTLTFGDVTYRVSYVCDSSSVE